MFKFIKKHQKATKITAIVILSLAVLAVGAILIINKLVGDIKPPEEISATEDFEYETLDSLKEVYKVPEEELSLSISDYAESDAYKVYRRAYNNFLNSGNYYISTEGYTNANGIYVNINNEKKFDGVNFFMHTRSLAEDGGMFAQASDGSNRHYLYVNNQGGANFATVERLNPYDETEVLKEKVLSEKDYVFNYGAIPYASCNYTIRENTILSATLTKDEGTGLYVIAFNLHPVDSTVNQVKNMYAVSGTDVSYEDGSVLYTVYVDSNFMIRKVTVEEEYTVKALGVSMGADAGLTDTYYYPGEEGYKPLAEHEKYDISNVPVVENTAERQEIATAMSNAIDKVLNNSVNADMSLSVDGKKLLDGRLQVLAKDYTVIELETAIEGMQIKAHIQIKADGSGNILLDVDGIKVGFTFNKLSEFVETVLMKMDIDLGGLSISLVGQIVDNLDFRDIIAGFKNSEGTKADGKYLYTANLKEVSSIPLDIPFDLVVSDNKIQSFKIDNKNVMGAQIDLTLTPSSKTATATLKDMEADRANVTPILYEALDLVLGINNENSVAGSLVAQLKNKQFTIKGGVNYLNTAITIENVKIENVGDATNPLVAFENGDLNASIDLKLGENTVRLTYTDGSLYVDYNNDLSAKMTKTTIKYLLDKVIGNYGEIIDGFNLTEVQALLDAFANMQNVSLTQIVSMIKTFNVTDQEINIGLDLSSLNLGMNQVNVKLYFVNGLLAVSVSADEKLTANLTLDNTAFDRIVAPTGEYIDLNDTSLIDAAIQLVKDFNVDGSVVNTLYKQLSSKQFTLNGDISANGTTITLKDLRIDISDGISASGSIILGADEISFVYVGGNIYASYGDVASITMDKETIEYLINAILTNYEEILNGFNLTKVLDMINQVKSMENMKIADIFGMLKSISVVDGEINLTIDGTSVELGDIALKLFINTDKLLSVDGTIGETNTIKLSVDNTAFDTIVAPTGEYIDLNDTSLIDAAIQLVKDFNVDGSVVNTLYKQLSSKQFTLNGDIAVDGTTITLKDLRIDISDGISASGSIILGADEISFVYVGGNIYASYGDVASITMDKGTIEYLINAILTNYEEILNGFNLTKVLDMINQVKSMKNMKIADIFGMLKSISVVDGEINLTIDGTSVELGDIALKLFINTDKLLSVDGTIGETNTVKLSVDNTAFDRIVAPTGEYIDLNDTSLIDAAIQLVKDFNVDGSVVNTLYKQLSSKQFTLNGDISANGTTITLKDLRIENVGNVADPLTSLKNGEISVSGSILIGVDEIKITYVGGNVYVSYGELASVNMNKATVEYLLDAILTNYEEILNGFNLTKVLDMINQVKSMKNMKIADIFGMLKSISVVDGEINLTIDGKSVELGDIALKLFINTDKLLSVDGTIGETNTVKLSVDNTAFDTIVAPTGEYIDLNDTSLIDAVLEILKTMNSEGSVANTVYKQFSQRYFTFNGEINMGGTVITLQNIRVENQGDLTDPKGAFNSGDLRISGTILIGADVKIDITYADTTLYIMYNDKIGAKFERASLDYILQLVIDNYDLITDKIDLSNLVSTENGKINFAELSIADIFGMLKGLTVANDTANIKLDGSIIGLNLIELNIFFGVSGDVELSGIFGENFTASLALSNEQFDTITSPTGDFIDLNNTTYVDALLELLKTWDVEGTVANKISKQLDQTYFNFSGEINLGGTIITLQNIKVQNSGDPKDPMSAFDNGLLSISGTILINSTDKIDIVYVGNVLYICYNDAIRVKLDRVSLDYIVALVMNNYKDIIGRLNYSNMLGSIENAEALKETSYADLFAMITSLTVSRETINILINGGDMGEISINAVIDELGNLMISGTIGTNGSITITMNNDVTDTIVAPTDSYIDFSNSKYLIEGFINAILKESQDYYLSGTANMNFINLAKVNIGITVSVRLVDKLDGGKSVEAVITVSNMDYGVLGGVVQKFIKYGQGTMIFKDGNVYIQRENYKYSSGFFGLGSSFKSEGVQYKKMTGAYFGQNTLNEIGFFIGFTDTLLNLIQKNNVINIESLLNDYSGTETLQTIKLNGSAIDTVLGVMQADITLAEVNSKRQMTKLVVGMPVDFGIAKINISATFDHYLDQSGNYTEIGLIDSKYGSLEFLDVTTTV